jgi:hypothetical protein
LREIEDSEGSKFTRTEFGAPGTPPLIEGKSSSETSVKCLSGSLNIQLLQKYNQTFEQSSTKNYDPASLSKALEILSFVFENNFNTSKIDAMQVMKKLYTA